MTAPARYSTTTLTPRKLIRYAERVHDDKITPEVLAFVRSLGDFDPARVETVEFEPPPPNSHATRLPRFYVTSRLTAPPAVERETETVELETVEVIYRGVLPRWWFALCSESDSPLDFQT